MRRNPDLDPRIQTHQTFIKPHNGNNSRSRLDPDPRIALKVMRMHPDLDSQIFILKASGGPEIPSPESFLDHGTFAWIRLPKSTTILPFYGNPPKVYGLGGHANSGQPMLLGLHRNA